MIRQVIEKIVIRHICKDGFRYDKETKKCVKMTPLDKKKLDCREKPGMKWDSEQERCVRMSPDEIMKAKKAAKKRLMKMKDIKFKTKKAV